MMKILTKIQMSLQNISAELYACISHQARQYIFFKDYEVPDTPQGRFEMLALHVALMMRRLKLLWPNEQESYAHVSQDVVNWVVADIEESIRSMRVSDLKISRHLKAFIEGFYGRLMAYDKALEDNDKIMLEETIRRNVYGVVDKVDDQIVEGLVDYVCQTWDWLQETSLSQIILDLKED